MDTIDLTPVGCMTPEGCARVARAAEELERARGECALVLAEMVDDVGAPPGYRQAAREAVAAWRAATNEFLMALAGQARNQC